MSDGNPSKGVDQWVCHASTDVKRRQFPVGSCEQRRMLEHLGRCKWNRVDDVNLPGDEAAKIEPVAAAGCQ